MPEFEYTARTGKGHTVQGMLIAKDQTDLAQKLELQGLTLTRATLGRKKSLRSTLGGFFHQVPSVQKMFFTQYLHVLIKAGFSIARALDTLAKQTSNAYFRTVITEVRADVEAGMSFSKSLAKHPSVFNEFYVSMVSAGEASGKLDEVLDRLQLKMRKDHGLLSKVRGALTYPIIIVVTMVGVALLITIVVIPRLSQIFQEAGADLPLPTKVLIAFSNFLINQGFLLLPIAVVIFYFLLRIIRSERGRARFDGIILHVPLLGRIIRIVSLARFSRSLASLLQTNIPIIETFLIISRTMGNRRYRFALEEVAHQLKTGSTITKILETRPELFPPLTTQMIAVGEESGALDTIAAELASFYEEEVDQTLTNLSTIIEPVLMIFLGLGVAAMAVAVILPIYSLSQQIG